MTTAISLQHALVFVASLADSPTPRATQAPRATASSAQDPP